MRNKNCVNALTMRVGLLAVLLVFGGTDVSDATEMPCASPCVQKPALFAKASCSLRACCVEKQCPDDYRCKPLPRVPRKTCGLCDDYRSKCLPSKPCPRASICDDYHGKPLPYLGCRRAGRFYRCPPPVSCCQIKYNASVLAKRLDPQMLDKDGIERRNDQ